jgi:CheY-like chemotaxis protein
VRELIQNVLESYQYQVTVASSGPEALRLWAKQQGKFDLLLTDMIMPGGMTGHDLSRELKKQKPGLKVIYTSGYSAELGGRDLQHTGMPFLSKPFLPDRIASLVRQCLDDAPAASSTQTASTIVDPGHELLPPRPEVSLTFPRGGR